MPVLLHPSLLLGPRKPRVSEDETIAERIRLVLETRPGTLPWRPDFGCDLGPLVGQPANSQRLNEARWKVEQALRRWLPELELTRCEVNVVFADVGPGRVRYLEVPLAESALLSLGTQAGLEIVLDVETPSGPLAVQAVVDP